MDKKVRYVYAVVIFVAAVSFVGCQICSDGGMNTEKVFFVDDFGAVADGKTDCGPALRKAVAAAINAGSGSKVVFGPGKYRIGPEYLPPIDTKPDDAQTKDSGDELCKKYEVFKAPPCVEIRGAENLSIVGKKDKTELVVTSPLSGIFYVTDSNSILIKDIIIDKDPLPFTQGTVVAVNLANATFDLRIDKGYPSLGEYWFEKADAKWGMCYDDAGFFKLGGPSAAFIDSWQRVKGKTWRMKLHDKKHAKLFDKGDRFVHLARGGKSAMMFWNCRNVLVDNTTVYSHNSGAVSFFYCSGDLTVRGVKVLRRPGTTRLLSTCADGIHCRAAVKGPLVENCVFEGMADDGINIYTSPMEVREVLDIDTVRVTSANLVKPGDRLQIIEPVDGIIKADEIVAVNVENDLITFDRAVEGLKAGKNFRETDTIYNLSACGSRFVIRNNTFGGFRGRGILIRAHDGLIENNLIRHTSGQGIVLANEPTWPEGPMPARITIRNNTLDGVCRDSGGSGGAAIHVLGCGLEWVPAKNRSIRDIVIKDNKIVDPSGRAIFASSVNNLVVENNNVKLSKDGRSYDSYKGVQLFNCGDVVIKNFTITDPLKRFEYAVRIESDCAAGDDGVKLKKLKADLKDGGSLVVDER